MNFKDLAGLGLAPLTGGLSLGLVSEDTRAGLPVIGPLTGAKSDEQKRLEQTQQRLAAEQKQRMEQQRQVQMQNMANRMMAFAPMNNHVASRLGPQAAFSPEQMSQFAADPAGPPQVSPQLQAWMNMSDNDRNYVRGHQADKSLMGGRWSGVDLRALDQQHVDFLGKQRAEQARRAQVAGAFQGMPQGPEQIPISAPAPARRF